MYFSSTCTAVKNEVLIIILRAIIHRITILLTNIGFLFKIHAVIIDKYVVHVHYHNQYLIDNVSLLDKGIAMGVDCSAASQLEPADEMCQMAVLHCDSRVSQRSEAG